MFHLDLTDKQNCFLFPIFDFHPPLSLFLQRFACMWFCELIIYIKTTHVFYSFLFPAHYFPHMSRSNTHTDAQMSNAGGTFFKMSEEDKEWWKPTRSNKRQRSLGGMGAVWPRQEKKELKKRQKVMKHSSRGSVKLNEESGPRANAGHKKREKKIRRPLTPSTHRSAKSL